MSIKKDTLAFYKTIDFSRVVFITNTVLVH